MTRAKSTAESNLSGKTVMITLDLTNSLNRLKIPQQAIQPLPAVVTVPVRNHAKKKRCTTAKWLKDVKTTVASNGTDHSVATEVSALTDDAVTIQNVDIINAGTTKIVLKLHLWSQHAPVVVDQGEAVAE